MQDLKNWSPLLLFGEINRQKFSLFLPLFSMRTLGWLFCCAIGVTNTTALPSSFGNLLKWQLSWTCSYIVPSYLVPLKNTCPNIKNKITEMTLAYNGIRKQKTGARWRLIQSQITLLFFTLIILQFDSFAMNVFHVKTSVITKKYWKYITIIILNEIMLHSDFNVGSVGILEAI